MDVWRTPNGKPLTLAEIFEEIKLHARNEGKVYIGTDSFIDKNRCAFATAICLHGASGQRGGKYFFRKVFYKRQNFSSLVQRIMHEAFEVAKLYGHSVTIDGRWFGTDRSGSLCAGFTKKRGTRIWLLPVSLEEAQGLVNGSKKITYWTNSRRAEIKAA